MMMMIMTIVANHNPLSPVLDDHDDSDDDDDGDDDHDDHDDGHQCWKILTCSLLSWMSSAVSRIFTSLIGTGCSIL